MKYPEIPNARWIPSESDAVDNSSATEFAKSDGCEMMSSLSFEYQRKRTQNLVR